jgi:hypothetical protein
MTKKVILALVALATFGLTACEKVVQLNIDSDDPIVIIDAQITNRLEKWRVNLSLTQPYFDQSKIDYIETAQVIITDSDGTADTLAYDTAGTFVSWKLKKCEVGKSYTLTVNYNGETYTATETCYYQDTMDFIQSYYLPERNGFIPEGHYVFQKSDEHEPDGDYYLWRIYRNGADQLDSTGYLLDTDEFRSTGFWNIQIDPDDPLKDIDRGVYPRPFPLRFDEGDFVQVEQLRISEDYFDFLTGFASQQSRAGTPFDPPPANPQSNIRGGAYGYFSVVNITEKSVTVGQ